MLPGSMVVMALCRLRPLAILDEADRAPAEAMHRQHQLRGRHVGPDFALGPTEVRQQQHDCAAVAQLQHRRQHRPQPRVVADLRALHRHVEVDADQHLLARQILRQVVEGLETLIAEFVTLSGAWGRMSKTCARDAQSISKTRASLSPSSKLACTTTLTELGHRRGGVDHAVREAPFIVVPADDADQLAFDHRGFEAVDGRALRRVDDVDRD